MAVRYLADENLTIRDMEPADVLPLCEEERAQGWRNASPEKNESRLRDRDAGRCAAITALWQGEPAGYVSVYWNPVSGPFAGMGIPEIVDFNVIERLRRRGIGSRLMDVAEHIAAGKCSRVCIGVGLHGGYGSAQRMYVRRGYMPDGSGVWYRDQNLPEGAPCMNDDDLVLYLSKSLGGNHHDGD